MSRGLGDVYKRQVLPAGKEVSVFVISCAASLAVLPLQPTRKIIRQARTQGISLFFISIAPFALIVIKNGQNIKGAIG